MKKYPLALILALLTLPGLSPLKAAESRPAETRPETRPVPQASMIDEALTLVEIYGKVRKILGKDDRSDLKVQLDRLNGALDRILTFKSSFTPKKLERIENQMSQVKTDAAQVVTEDVSKTQAAFLKLSDSLLDLVKILMEPAPKDRF